MRMTDIGKKAKDLGIESNGMTKADLIHSIQGAEGSFECYGHFGTDCPHTSCCFRADCAKEK